MAKPRPIAPGPRWPWNPVDLEVHEVSAIKAMAAQHPLAYELLINKVCGVSRLSFTAGGEDGRRASDFGEGLRFAGCQMRNIRDVEIPARRLGSPPGEPVPGAAAPSAGGA